MKVLLADDRVENRYLGQALLQGSGHDVVTASNGSEALEKVRQEKFDLIISDIMMPVMDGFQLCRELKSDPHLSTVPFIFYTATYTDPRDEAFARSLGACDFIAKPVEPEVFLERISSVLQKGVSSGGSDPIDETAYFKEYSHRLVKKLERKISEVESINAQLKDVNENLEKRILEKTEKLEIKNRELETFAYSVAHDLRAPLRALQGLSTALLEEYVHCLDATGQHYANRIIKAAHKMEVLIQDLLAYSKLTQTEVILETFDPSSVVNDVLEQLEALIKESGAEIKVEGAMPQVRGNRGMLNQAISNLVVNAIKFVPDGVQPRLRIHAEANDKAVRLWVEDNGIGIAPEFQERIFQVFERLHDASKYPGTGVGLAIVQKAAERLEGRAGVESELGKGSRFWIELPKPDQNAAGTVSSLRKLPDPVEFSA